MSDRLQLRDLVPNNIFVGTSSIIRRGERFLYGIRPPKQGVDYTIFELTGIGGSLERFDESYSAGLLREAQEEIGCQIDIVPAAETIVVYALEDVRSLPLDGEERPAAVVFRQHRTPPHQPWHPQNQGPACLIVFLAELMGSPRPVMELPYLIWLPAEQILETARRDVPLHELLAAGAELVAEPQGRPPLDGMCRMTDSQEALALALGDQTTEVYLAFGSRV
jgi:hypothetical protein